MFAKHLRPSAGQVRPKVTTAQGHYILGGRRTNNKTKDSGWQMVHGLLHPIALVGTATQGVPTTWLRSLLGFFCNSGTNGCSFSRDSMEHWTEQM